MESIHGKRTGSLSLIELNVFLGNYRQVWLDLGTGDGRYVEYLAKFNPTCFVIGLDACRENLRYITRRSPANALYLIANAENLPRDLTGLADRVTINFPWGSLLAGLLDSDSKVYEGLRRVTRPDARVEIRLNGQAALVAGWEPEAAARRIKQALQANGFEAQPPQLLTANDLRTCPTSWAKRLASGNNPQTYYLLAQG